MSQTRYLTEAYNSFITGCKSDGIWDAIKAACVMAGWDGLAGGLTPIKGAAPTNVNFVAGDWNRKTGLLGDGSTKYLNSNRNSNADGQDDAHFSIYVQTASAASGDTARIPIGAQGSSVTDRITLLTTQSNFISRSQTTTVGTTLDGATGFQGASRTSSTAHTYRFNGTTSNGSTNSSGTPQAVPWYVFCRNNDGTAASHTATRLQWYSIGSSLNLALLDARVTRLMDDIAFVINYGLSPLGYHSEAVNWANRVAGAGATVSTSTLGAVSTFCSAIDSAGIRDRFRRLNLFAGSSLTAALVPLYRSSSYGGAVLGGSSDTNTNFVSGDYAEVGSAAGGLTSNGTKYLSTGLAMAESTLHLSAFVFKAEAAYRHVCGTNTAQMVCGVPAYRIYVYHHTDAGANTGAVGTYQDSPDLKTFSAGPGLQRFWSGSTKGDSDTNKASAPTSANSVLVFNADGNIFAGRLGGYSVGLSMTDAQVASYNTAIRAFQTSMQRL